MSTTVRVELPSGRAIALRPVGDEDEAFILDTADSMLPGARATALVERCLANDEPAPALTIGDRDAALLHLRRLSLGESVDCALPCPSVGCGESLEWQVPVSDLLIEPDATGGAPELFTIDVDAEGARFHVTFRLPTAADVDRVATQGADRIEHAAQMLFRQCVIGAERDDVGCTAADLPATVRSAVEDALAAADRQAEIQLAMRCPACGLEFTSLFDTAVFFLRELDARATRTLRDIHLLALHYHWSESDILRMPARRRAQYIELVRNAMARGRPR